MKRTTHWFTADSSHLLQFTASCFSWLCSSIILVQTTWSSVFPSTVRDKWKPSIKACWKPSFLPLFTSRQLSTTTECSTGHLLGPLMYCTADLFSLVTTVITTLQTASAESSDRPAVASSVTLCAWLSLDRNSQRENRHLSCGILFHTLRNFLLVWSVI